MQITRFFGPLLAMAVLGGAVDRAAAAPVFDDRGFNQNRAYFTPLPVEHIDPMTGNVLLTFTDLALPGNAGLDLKIQRTYNSKIYRDYQGQGDTPGEDSWAGLGWTLHMGRVIDPFSTTRPIIEMPDGSRHPCYRRTPDPILTPSEGFLTRDHWFFYMKNGKGYLNLPTGVVYTFERLTHITTLGDVLYATEIKDPYGNTITVKYMTGASAPPDGIDSIVQEMGGNAKRTIRFSFDPAGGRSTLRTMTYDNRTWEFTQEATTHVGYSLLTEVRPPIGPSWSYDYNRTAYPSYELTMMRAPSGGEVHYEFEEREFYLGTTYPVRSRALVRRTTSGPSLAPGEWQYAYSQGAGMNETVITTPCRNAGVAGNPCTTVTHTFAGIGNYGTGGVPVWQIGLLSRKVTREGATVLETEDLEWVPSAPISLDDETVGFNHDADIYVPLLKRRTITRGGSQAYTTTLDYRADHYNDFGRAYRTVEQGELGRTTTRTFPYYFASGLFIADRVDTETVSVDAEDHVTSNRYDSATGFLLSQTVSGVTTEFGPFNNGNVKSAKDANGYLTQYAYAWGNVQKVATPEYTITRVVNPDGTIQSETRRGFTTSFLYDALSRKTRVTPPAGNDTVIEYDNASARAVTVRRGPSWTKTDLDGFGRDVGTTNSVGVRTERTLDACGRAAFESYPFSGVKQGVSFTFDGLSRVGTARNPDNTVVRREYLGIDTRIFDENNHPTFQDWSAFGTPDGARLVAVTDAASKTTNYAYNAIGKLTEVRPPVGGRHSWTYNAKNFLVSEEHPETGIVRYTHDNVGNVKTRQDRAFGTTLYTYDKVNRLRFVDYPQSAHDTKIDFDESDNRTFLGNSYVGSTFTYDGANRLRSRTDIIDGFPFAVTYTPDGNGNVVQIDYPSGGRASYAYDSENRIASVGDGTGFSYARDFQYHPSGGVTSFRNGNGILQSIDYDQRYRVERVRNGVLDLGYLYDGVGNVLVLSDTRPGMNQSFGYDALDRLTSGTGWYGQLSFGHDDLGNRLSKVVGGAATTYHYDLSTNYLTSASGQEADHFDYDGNGNLQKTDTLRFTYAPTNQVATAVAGPTGATYRYDGDLRRLVRTVGQDTTYTIRGASEETLSEFKRVGAGAPLPARDYIYAGTRILASVEPTVLAVNPSTVTLAAVVGGQAVSQSVLVTTGTAAKPWSAVSSAPWLTIVPASGTTPGTATLVANPAGLAAGTRTATATFSSPGTPGSPRVVAVTLIVNPTTGLVVAPAALEFTMVEGDAAPAPQTLSVVYAGGTTQWTTAASATWLSLSPESGTTPAAISVAVDASKLASGTYSATITVTDTGAPGAPSVVTVTLVIQPAAEPGCAAGAWYCEPFDELEFGDLGGQGGWTTLPGNAAGQVEVDPRGGGKVLVLDAPARQFVKEFIALADTPIDGSEISMQVMTHAVPEATKQVAKIEFFTVEGTAWGKTTRTYGALRFGSDVFLQWGRNIYERIIDAVVSDRWYDVKIRYTADHRIEAFVDGVLVSTLENPLAVGLPHQAFATTAWDLPGFGALDVISLRPTPAQPNPELRVEPAILSFTAPQGTTPPAQTLTVRDPNLPTGPVWQATASAAWITVTPTSGTAPSTVNVTTSTQGLAAGTYVGSITVSADAIGSPQVVEVTLTVTALEPPSISGTFRTTDGTSVIPNAQMIAVVNYAEAARTRTDSQGHYVFQTLPAGYTKVIGLHPTTGYPGMAEVDTVAGPYAADVRMARTGTVHLRTNNDVLGSPATTLYEILSTPYTYYWRAQANTDAAGVATIIAPAEPLTREVPRLGVIGGSTYDYRDSSFGGRNGPLVPGGALDLEIRSGNREWHYNPFVATPYTMDAGGRVALTSDSPFAGPHLRVGEDWFVFQNVWIKELDGRGAGLESPLMSGLTVERHVYVPTSGNYARSVDTLENRTGASVTVDLVLRHEIATDQGVLRTSSGDAQVTNGDRFVILGGGGNANALTYVAQGAVTATQGMFSPGSLEFTWRGVVVPAGGRVALLSFTISRPNGDTTTAEAQATALANLTDPEALYGLSPEVLASIINFNAN